MLRTRAGFGVAGFSSAASTQHTAILPYRVGLSKLCLREHFLRDRGYKHRKLVAVAAPETMGSQSSQNFRKHGMRSSIVCSRSQFLVAKTVADCQRGSKIDCTFHVRLGLIQNRFLRLLSLVAEHSLSERKVADPIPAEGLSRPPVPRGCNTFTMSSNRDSRAAEKPGSNAAIRCGDPGMPVIGCRLMT